MTTRELRHRLGTVLGWSEAAIELRPLPEGTGGRSCLLSYRGERYVLRVDDVGAGEIRPRMSSEPTVLERAAIAGLGPELVHADPAAGLLVTRYIEGRVWTDADLCSPPALELLAGLLRRVHQLPVTGDALDLAGYAEAYRGRLHDRPEYAATADRCVTLIASTAPVTDQRVCCHNDVVAGNVIEGRDLRLIDWEYTADNDPYFDLASMIGYHDLPQSASDVLLQSYTGGAGSADRERLREQLRLFDALQWLWLASRQVMAADEAQAKRLSVLAARLSR